MKNKTAVQASDVIHVLTVTTADDSAVQATLVQLSHAGADAAVLMANPDLPELTKGTKVLVPVLPPHIALAVMIDAGADLETALSDWTIQAGAILAHCRSLRTRAVVVDALALAAGEPNSIDLVHSKFDLQLTAFKDTALTVGSAPAQSIAATLLSLDADAGKIAKSLETKLAGTTSYARPEGSALLAQLSQAMMAGTPAAADQTDLITPLQAECDELRESLIALSASGTQEQVDRMTHEVDLLRETLGGALRALQESEAVQATQATQLHQQQDEIADKHMLAVLNDSLENRLREKDQENRRREGVLGSVLLQREGGDRQQLKELAQVREQLQATEQYAHDLQAEIDRIYKSKSWKITSPMRSIRRDLTKGSNS